MGRLTSTDSARAGRPSATRTSQEVSYSYRPNRTRGARDGYGTLAYSWQSGAGRLVPSADRVQVSQAHLLIGGGNPPLPQGEDGELRPVHQAATVG
jgi:hypothetical protein